MSHLIKHFNETFGWDMLMKQFWWVLLIRHFDWAFWLDIRIRHFIETCYETFEWDILMAGNSWKLALYMTRLVLKLLNCKTGLLYLPQRVWHLLPLPCFPHCTDGVMIFLKDFCCILILCLLMPPPCVVCAMPTGGHYSLVDNCACTVHSRLYTIRGVL